MKSYISKYTYLLLIVAIVLIGCNDNSKQVKEVKLSKEKLLFLYSHPREEHTVLVSTENGENFKSKYINKSDIFNIEKKDSSSIYLVPTHESKLYLFKDYKKIEEMKISNPLNFVISDNEIEIKAINEDLEKNILKVKDKKYNQEFKLEFKPFLKKAIYNENFIYLLNDEIDYKNTNLQIVNRGNGKLEKSINLKTQVEDIIEYNNTVILVNEGNLFTLSDNSTIKKFALEGDIVYPEKLHVWKENLFLSSVRIDNGKMHLMKFDKNLKLLKQQTFNISLTKSRFLKNKAYILEQKELGEKDGGTLIEIDLNSFKEENKISLPKEKVKVQDFIVNE